LKVGKTKRGKGTKIMAVADRHGLPVSICIESATPHEVKLATFTLVQMVVPDAPGHLIGDNAYDSDKLDAQLRPGPPLSRAAKSPSRESRFASATRHAQASTSSPESRASQ
jgi:hypothetical protein